MFNSWVSHVLLDTDGKRLGTPIYHLVFYSTFGLPSQSPEEWTLQLKVFPYSPEKWEGVEQWFSELEFPKL